MGFGIAFNIAQQSLSTISKRAEITGNNIANINTSGFRKQLLIQSAVYSQSPKLDIGSGVRIDAITSPINYMLEKQKFEVTGKNEFNTELLQNLETFETSFTASASSFADAINEFKSNLSSAASYPTNPGVIETVYGSAERLVNSFNDLMDDFSLRQNSLTSRKEMSIKEANLNLIEVDEYNKKIDNDSYGSLSENAKAAALDKAVDVAEFVGGTMYVDSKRKISITISNKTLLSEDTISPLEEKDIPKISLGRIGGMNSSEKTFKEMQDSIKSAFKQFTEAFNNVYTENGTEGSDLFVYNENTKKYGLSITDGKDLSLGVNGKKALSLAGTDSIENPNSFSNSLIKNVASLGMSINEVKASGEVSSSSLFGIDSSIQEQSGVSLDEEAINLSRIQVEYQAMARVLQVQDNMYGTLLNIST